MNQLSIRRLRQLAGKTKNEIADLLGMSVNTYSKYEDNPMSLSYAAYHQLIEYLETAIQIRKKLEKEQPMNTPIKAKVRFVAPDEDDEDRLSDYTVPIPEGLTEEFHPSQPVTPKQLLDWETKNKEPYPGYSEEFFNWENAWEEVNRAQQKADGGYLPIQGKPCLLCSHGGIRWNRGVAEYKEIIGYLRPGPLNADTVRLCRGKNGL